MSSQPSLHQVAERLLHLAQTLRQDYSIPEELTAELVTVSTQCTLASTHLESGLRSLELCLSSLRREYPRRPDDLDHLRPDVQGQYVWDRWQTMALEAGLSSDMATLGRAVMREAVQHDWRERLKAECGWQDQGQAMLELARRDGPAAQKRWTYLLETDGERGRWTAHGDWEPFATQEEGW